MDMERMSVMNKKKSVLLMGATAALIGTLLIPGTNGYANAEEVQAVSQTKSVNMAQYTLDLNDQKSVTSGYWNFEAKQIMLPLREVSEALGFKVTWNEENRTVEVSKANTPTWTLLQAGKDEYAYNKMYKSLGAAPVIHEDKMYVPVSFYSTILQAKTAIAADAPVIKITSPERKAATTTNGVVTAVHNEEKRKAIHINGVGTEGLILNVDENTVIHNTYGEALELKDLTLGTEIQAIHSLAMTMSLPGQTYTFEITVKSGAAVADSIGTQGTVQDVQVDDKGVSRVHIKGMGITDKSPEEVVLTVSSETIIVDKDGKSLQASELKKDARLLAFYGPVLSKSLPPIGKAWKIVVMGQE